MIPRRWGRWFLTVADFRLEKFREQRLQVHFPDEMDTPQDTNARTRFQRFRGLKSFHASPWDPKENLPVDYSRIFQFKNFHRIRRRVLQIDEDECDGALVSYRSLST